MSLSLRDAEPVPPQKSRAPLAVLAGAGMAIVAIGVVLVAGGAWYWFYGPCGRVPTAAAAARLTAQSERFADELKIAASTPMLALAGPLSKLQEVRRDTKGMEVPACATTARDTLALAMDKSVEGFMATVQAQMSQRSADDAWVMEAKGQFTRFAQEAVRLRECAPRCDWPILSGER